MPRAETKNIIPGKIALSVGLPDLPVPPSWQWTKLSDVARLESGHTPSREHPEYWSGEIPWVGIKDAREAHGRIVDSTFQTVTPEGIANSAARLLPQGTVCLSRTASVGYTCILGKEMATSQDFVNWICSDLIVPEFLMHLFIAERESLLKFGKGTTHTTVYFPEVQAFHVCLPPPEEQRRIVSKLSDLGARSRRAKEALAAIPPLLNRFRQSVLAAAFRGDLTTHWRATHPGVESASVLLNGLRNGNSRGVSQGGIEEPPTTLPPSWKWARVSWIADVQLGRQRSPEHHEGPDMRPYLRAANVTWSGLNLSDVKQMNFSGADFSRHALMNGDILLSEASGSRYEVGKPAIWAGEIADCCCQNTLIRVRCRPPMSPEYLHLHFLHDAISGAFGRATTGIGILHLGQATISKWFVALPPLEEQLAIVSMVRQLLKRQESLEESLTQATGRFDDLLNSILAKAFRGELVPQDPNDEPASILLERLRSASSARPEGKRPRARRNDPQ